MFTDFDDDIVVDLPLPVDTRVYLGLPQVKHLLSHLHRFGKRNVLVRQRTAMGCGQDAIVSIPPSACRRADPISDTDPRRILAKHDTCP